MAVLVTLVAVMGHPDPTLDQHWQLWKKAHGKEYRHQVWGEVGNGGTAAVPGDELRGRVWFQAEEGQRRATWEKNLRLVMLHNLEHSLGLHSYQLGMNHMGDMVRGHRGMGRGKPCRMGCPGRRGVTIFGGVREVQHWGAWMVEVGRDWGSWRSFPALIVL